MDRREILRMALALPLVLGAIACQITAPDRDEEGSVTVNGDIVSGTGTVRYFDLEGGFYAIRGDDERVYDPINLAAEFRRDPLRIRFRARIRNDLGSFHMVGPVVEILEIERL